MEKKAAGAGNDKDSDGSSQNPGGSGYLDKVKKNLASSLVKKGKRNIGAQKR